MSDPEKVCDGAGCENPAVVHHTHVVGNKTSTQYLCKSCAGAKGIDPEPASEGFDVSDFLAQLGEVAPSRAGSVPSEPCTFCGLTFDGFKESGRLGCPHCYTSFEPGLRRLLSRIHGSTQHVGKVYLPPDPAEAELGRRLDGLRRRLQRAVEVEDFERAALLRDQIRELETAG